MPYSVDVQRLPAQQMATIRGRTTQPELPKTIRTLFDQFYAGFKGKPGLNIVFYPGPCADSEFDLECGVQVESGGNSLTPGGSVVKATFFGPYDQMGPAHEAIREWSRQNGRRLAGPSWEVYGHWSDDPAQRRTDIFYLVAP